jgi:hypothetical protein
MRFWYGVFKGAAFCLLALALGLRRLWEGTPKAGSAEVVWISAVVISWIATAFCVIRGAPVLLEAPAQLRDLDARVAEKTAER